MHHLHPQVDLDDCLGAGVDKVDAWKEESVELAKSLHDADCGGFLLVGNGGYFTSAHEGEEAQSHRQLPTLLQKGLNVVFGLLGYKHFWVGQMLLGRLMINGIYFEQWPKHWVLLLCFISP